MLVGSHSAAQGSSAAATNATVLQPPYIVPARELLRNGISADDRTSRCEPREAGGCGEDRRCCIPDGPLGRDPSAMDGGFATQRRPAHRGRGRPGSRRSAAAHRDPRMPPRNGPLRRCSDPRSQAAGTAGPPARGLQLECLDQPASRRSMGRRIFLGFGVDAP